MASKIPSVLISLFKLRRDNVPLHGNKFFNNIRLKIVMRLFTTIQIKLVNKYPNNPNYRHTFFFFRSKLKHLCKYEEKKYRNKVLSELQVASDKNATAFWDKEFFLLHFFFHYYLYFVYIIVNSFLGP
jgi:hypothetical protein